MMQCYIDLFIIYVKFKFKIGEFISYEKFFILKYRQKYLILFYCVIYNIKYYIYYFYRIRFYWLFVFFFFVFKLLFWLVGF